MNPQQHAGGDHLLDEQTADFTGREWVLQAIDQWLAHPEGNRFFLLTGPSGSGKSAIAARVVQINWGQVPAPGFAHLSAGFLAYAHFCHVGQPSSLRLARFVEGLSQALADHLPSFRHALLDLSQKEAQPGILVSQQIDHAAEGTQVTGIHAEQLSIQVLGDNVRAAFDTLVRRPFQHRETSGSKTPVVVLIDALDEALTYDTHNYLVRFLRDEVDADVSLPAWLRFLLTARLDPRIRLRRARDSLDLVHDAPEKTDDVRGLRAHPTVGYRRWNQNWCSALPCAFPMLPRVFSFTLATRSTI